MSTLITVIVGIPVLILLFVLIPFEISLPSEIYGFLVGGFIADVFKTINYFLPLNFIISCLLTIYAIRYAGIFFNIVSWIYHKIF